MKKITLYIFILLPLFSFSQSPTDLQGLIERFNNLPTTVEDVGTVIKENFNTTERKVLVEYLSNRTLEQSISIPVQNRISLDFFYGVNAFTSDPGNDEFGTLDATPPYDSFNLISETFTQLRNSDITPDGTLYSINRGTFELVTIDRLNGSITTIGPLTNIISGYNPTGLSYNIINDTTYLITTNSNINSSILYSIDLSTGTLTEIGELGIAVPIWLAIDNNGGAWTADLLTDTIYSINLETAASTSLSNSIGININFAQDATYDHINEVLYMAAYTGGGTGGIYIVDTNTGLITLVGSTNALAFEFSCFSVDDQMALSVPENNLTNISVHPNPAKDKIFIENIDQTTIATYTMYDISGKKIVVPTENDTVDISQLSNGVYFLRIATSNGSTTKRIIKI